MNETTLCVLYEIASRTPGWLSKLETVCQLTEDEVGFLGWLDDQESKMNKRLRQMEAQMLRDGFEPELIDCETDNDRLLVINKLIFTLHDQHETLRKQDKSYLDRGLFLLVRRYDHWVKLRNKTRARMIYAEHPSPHGITEAELERARAYPLEKLVELDRTKHMLCPFHDDKSPSMWVSNGFGWCWACNAWCDSLRYLVEVKHMKFVEAVKELAHGQIG